VVQTEIFFSCGHTRPTIIQLKEAKSFEEYQHVEDIRSGRVTEFLPEEKGGEFGWIFFEITSCGPRHGGHVRAGGDGLVPEQHLNTQGPTGDL
jgi:hypothetical protein